MNHRRLLRFALVMWGAPLLAATLALYGFVFLRGPVFVASGAILMIAGGFCLTAGVIAVIAILATRNNFRETPRRTYRQRALGVLGLLVLNVPIAAGYAWMARALLERTPVQAVASPSGQHLAEVILLEAHDQPAYGLGVTLRPAPGYFFEAPRTLVFSAYCLKGPALTWLDDRQLRIACEGATAVARRLDRYREISLSYRVTAALPPRFER